MALNADIISPDEIQRFRIHDVRSRWMGHMFATRPMALFTTDIPFRHFFGFHVVIDGVATIAGWPRRPVGVAWTVIGDPPIGSGLDMVWDPTLLCDIPLRWQRVVVVPALGKIALLVTTAVYKRYVVQRESADRIRVNEVAKDSFRMFPGIPYNVGHTGLLPAVELIGMTAFAAFGTDKFRWVCGLLRNCTSTVEPKDSKGKVRVIKNLMRSSLEEMSQKTGRRCRKGVMS